MALVMNGIYIDKANSHPVLDGYLKSIGAEVKENGLFSGSFPGGGRMFEGLRQFALKNYGEINYALKESETIPSPFDSTSHVSYKIVDKPESEKKISNTTTEDDLYPVIIKPNGSIKRGVKQPPTEIKKSTGWFFSKNIPITQNPVFKNAIATAQNYQKDKITYDTSFMSNVVNYIADSFSQAKNYIANAFYGDAVKNEVSILNTKKLTANSVESNLASTEPSQAIEATPEEQQISESQPLEISKSESETLETSDFESESEIIETSNYAPIMFSTSQVANNSELSNVDTVKEDVQASPRPVLA